MMSFNNNINYNNNVSTRRSVDQFGNVTDTKIEQLPNGQINTSSITRDRNGRIIR